MNDYWIEKAIYGVGFYLVIVLLGITTWCVWWLGMWLVALMYPPLVVLFICLVVLWRAMLLAGCKTGTSK